MPARTDSAPPNARRAGRAKHRPQHAGKHMRMLVGVDVRQRDPLRLKQPNLRRGFGLNLGSSRSAL